MFLGFINSCIISGIFLFFSPHTIIVATAYMNHGNREVEGDDIIPLCVFHTVYTMIFPNNYQNPKTQK